MNVQQLIDELSNISDKKKPVITIWNAGTDFDKEIFIEEGIVNRVVENENVVELIDNLKPKY